MCTDEMPKRRYAKKSRRRTVKKRSTIKRRRTPTVKTLARRVNSLTRATWAPYTLQWSRPRLPFTWGYDPADSTKTPVPNAPFVYLCPIPVAPSVQFPSQASGANNPRGAWSDNGCGATVAGGLNRFVFGKGRTFIQSTNTTESGLCKHVGTTVTYRITQTQRDMQQYTVMLLSIKKDVADQMSLQRSLQYFQGDQTTGSSTNFIEAPGYKAELDESEDYIALGDQKPTGSTSFANVDPVHSVMINKQIWKVHYRKKFTLGFNTFNGPISDTSTQMSTGNAAQQPNLATGSVRVPGQGILRYVSKIQDKTVNAQELNYANQQSEQVFLLAIFGKNPASIADLNNMPKLSLQALDSYKMAN